MQAIPRLYVIVMLCCLTAGKADAQSQDELTIRNALAQQSFAWNRGSIDEFMDAYWKSDSLMFIGKTGVTYGWQQTMNNYKKGYPDTATMGKLTFEVVQIKKLSALYYSVTGRWQLSRRMGNVGGYFTLLWKRIKNRWVIVSDHTS